MSLEGLDGTLNGVAAVDVWWHKMVGAVPVFLDDALVFYAGFVVKHLGGDGMPQRLDTLHDRGVTAMRSLSLQVLKAAWRMVMESQW